jgi:hypothetical protein
LFRAAFNDSAENSLAWDSQRARIKTKWDLLSLFPGGRVRHQDLDVFSRQFGFVADFADVFLGETFE